MKEQRVFIRLPVGGRCEDCDLRDNLTITGRPRRDPFYGHKLTAGCETCVGTGIETRTVSMNAVRAYRLLTPKQRFVLERRLGHLDGRKYTQQEIAAVMGVTRQAVSELERNARLRLTRLATPTRNLAQNLANAYR